MGEIGNKVSSFYNSLKKEKNHRYKSWEHCYRYFQNKKSFDIDTAALHLGFFLASWGMYRASSFLLRKDYKIHTPIIKELRKSKYKTLYNLDYTKISPGAEKINQILVLVNTIKHSYKSRIEYVDTEKKKVEVSDTLATKILMGTLGSTPAYDRYFIAGLRKKGLTFSYLNNKNINKLIEFCNNNSKDIKKAQEKTNKQGIKYPSAKIIDMYFWQIGFDEEYKK